MITDIEAKKLKRSSREMATPLFLFRCTEIGISIADLELLSIGIIMDMWCEKYNDEVTYKQIAGQAEFDKF